MSRISNLSPGVLAAEDCEDLVGRLEHAADTGAPFDAEVVWELARRALTAEQPRARARRVADDRG